jgi:hypothetical protein
VRSSSTRSRRPKKVRPIKTSRPSNGIKTTTTTGERTVSLEAPVTGNAVYGEYLQQQLAEQATRKSSFEQRGLAVVTTAGTLVTLLFGLAAIASRTGKGDPFSHEEKVWLAIALVFFVLSALAALWTNLPIKYEAVEASDVKGRLKEQPLRDADAARRDIALTQTKVLEDAMTKNALKGRLLFAAMSLEVVAVTCVGIAIFEVINP